MRKTTIFAFLIAAVLFTGCMTPTYTKDNAYLIVSSRYLTMRDGTQIAVELFLPRHLTTGDKVPAVVEFTRYWRNFETNFITEIDTNYSKKGFAHVTVDVRGSGASEGVWDFYSPREIGDYKEVIDWVVSQPWSDGNIAVSGLSYIGGAAIHAAALGHPAVKALSPMFSSWDIYNDTVLPGGLYNHGYFKGWGDLCNLADLGSVDYFDYVIGKDKIGFVKSFVRGLKPVDSDTDRSFLQETMEKRVGKNLDFYPATKNVVFRDEPFPVSYGTTSLAEISGYSSLEAIEKSGTAIFMWEGWYDASNAYSALRSFNTLSNDYTLVIGPWGHGLINDVNQYAPDDRGPIVQPEEAYKELASFYNSVFFGGTGHQGKTLRYYTVGKDIWQTTDQWPPKDVTNQDWYFGENHNLSKNRPAAGGNDSYTVDFSTQTVEDNRYFLSYTDKVYGDQAEMDTKRLVYTSEPLAQGMEITGTPVISLYLKSTHEDGALFVYLEDVDEKGKVTYITEGAFRMIHRKISEPSGFDPAGGVEHSFEKKDAAPLIPGETTEVTFNLNPISAYIQEGHRIRIAIAGHDGSAFEKIPASGTPELAILRNVEYASHVILPVR